MLQRSLCDVCSDVQRRRCPSALSSCVEMHVTRNGLGSAARKNERVGIEVKSQTSKPSQLV
jgi:hypothetical protein